MCIRDRRKAVPDAWKGFKDFHFLATPASRGFHQLNPAGRNNSHKQHPDWKIPVSYTHLDVYKRQLSIPNKDTDLFPMKFLIGIQNIRYHI